ncbi:MAG: 3-dehydroquinate synthase [Maioricimonas sp. JB049]
MLIGGELLPEAGRLVGDWLSARYGASGKLAAVVSDRNVASHASRVTAGLHDAGFQTETVILEPGEKSKSMPVIASIYDRLVEMQADRKTVLVAVGGGVVGDAAGFAAATYARGIPFVQVPTTLLADVDSSVGGKVGINHPLAKNLIGAFHQPLGVIIDTEVLSTLPDRDYRAGMAEVVKYGVIQDAEFFGWLEENADILNERNADALRHAITRSCRLKADVVEQDEYERTGLRAILNYGHTFAHAFEALAGYGELLHGEAVAIGMIYASRLAERLGRIDAADTRRQHDLLDALHLPTSLAGRATLDADDVLERMKLDKKASAGKLRFVLPTRLGHVELVDDVPTDDVRAVLDEMTA